MSSSFPRGYQFYMSSWLFSVILRRDLYIFHHSVVLYLRIVAGLRRPFQIFLLSHLWGSSHLSLIFSIRLREFIPIIRWTFILSLTTGHFIFLFIEVWKLHFFSFHFLTLRVTVSFISCTWFCHHVVFMFGVHSRHLSFFLFGAHFRQLSFSIFVVHLRHLLSMFGVHSRHFSFFIYGAYFRHLFGWHFLVFTSFPSIREITFMGSLSTTPTWIGPFFHWDFRVILHSSIFTLFPPIPSIITVSRVASITPLGNLFRRSNDWDAPVSRKIETFTGPPCGPLITLFSVQGR